MNGKIGNIVKRENSTKSDFTSIDIVLNLKDSSSIINPVVIIDASVNAYEYNYLYIAQFSRFYFIRDCRWVLGVWELTCECDVLASWKTAILNANKYVLRSSSKYDTTIIDTFYPMRQASTYSTSENELEEWVLNVDKGCYIIGTISNTNAALGSTSYYVCTKTQANNFFEYMLNGVPNWDSISDFSGDVAKAFIDPFQYVVSCKWVPLPHSLLSDAIYTVADTIKFGFWDSKILARALLTTQFSITKTFSFPYAEDREFLWYPPYSSYWLYAGVFGVVPVQRANFNQNLTALLQMDLVNGMGTLKLLNNNKVVSQLSQKVSADIAISSIQLAVPTSLGEILSSAIGAGLSGVSALVAGGSVGDAALSYMTKAESSGQSEGITAIVNSRNWALIGQHFLSVEEDIAENGRPLCQNAQLKTLTGFCKVDDGIIKGNMLVEEQRKIQAYLEGGFFIE